MPTLAAEMETIIISDLHGRDIWKAIVARHPQAAYVFLGDYFDSKEGISAAAQINNFQALLQLRNTLQDRVTLLAGNHDFHYLPQAGERYSGFQGLHAIDIQEVLLPAVRNGLLQICHAVGSYLMSHAGFTCTWCRYHGIAPEDFLPDDMNLLWMMQPAIFRYSPGPKMLKNGDEPQQGPLWVRPPSLVRDGLPQWIQVVGHTQQEQPLLSPRVICMDVLAYTTKYLIINDNQTYTIASV